MPDDERAFLLKEHRRAQRRQQLRPAGQGVSAHTHHAVLGDGRLGQRCQHATGGAGGRVLPQWAAAVVNGDAVALAGQRNCQQSAHKASAENSVGVGVQCHRRSPVKLQRQNGQVPALETPHASMIWIG